MNLAACSPVTTLLYVWVLLHYICAAAVANVDFSGLTSVNWLVMRCPAHIKNLYSQLKMPYDRGIFPPDEAKEPLIKCACGVLRIFFTRILLQFLEIHKVFLQNCAAFWRKISRKSLLPI